MDTKELNLSQEQKKAIDKIDGQTLLLAVPGSGKTTTLIARLGRMIYDFGVDPGKILVITYTNNAAKDMKERFETIFSHQHSMHHAAQQPAHHSESIQFATINSFCNSVVERYARVTGRQKPKLETDTKGIIRHLYKSVYYDPYPEEALIGELDRYVTYIKNMALTDEIIRDLKCEDLPVAPMYEAYCKYMTNNQRMDYDDQIIFAKKALDLKQLKLKEYYSEKYQYILVDEAQDTSKIQHEVISQLVGENGNLFMVGDEDQSIYGFRAAYPEALVNFKQTYPRGEVYYLQSNYRSAKNIVEVADKLIHGNQQRYDKNMHAARKEKGEVKIINTRRRDQYEILIRDLKNHTDQPADQSADQPASRAILYRNNDSALPIISYFQQNGVPYNCAKCDSLFFVSRVIRDAVDIMSFAFDPAAKDIIIRIYYRFNLMVKKQTLQIALNNIDPRQDHPILRSLINCESGYSKKEKIEDLIIQLNNIRRMNNAKKAVHTIRTAMNYVNASSEKLFVLENIAFPDETIPDFISRLRRIENMVTKDHFDGSGAVTLSTIHGSKGLEYDEVYLIDAIEDILPDENNDEEEERRIFYVGITRAKNTLTLYRYHGIKSKFIDEISTSDKPATKGLGKRDFPSKGTDHRNVSETTVTNKKPTTIKHDFHSGNKVRHSGMGTGVIESIKDNRVVIKFDGAGKKTFALDILVNKNLLKKL